MENKKIWYVGFEFENFETSLHDCDGYFVLADDTEEATTRATERFFQKHHPKEVANLQIFADVDKQKTNRFVNLITDGVSD